MSESKKIKTIPNAKLAKANKRTVVYPKVTLFFDHILTTAFTRNITSSGLILQDRKGNIETTQTVVAVGPNAVVKVGDKVEIAPDRFKVKLSAPKHDIGPDVREVQVPLEEIDGNIYLFMSIREIKYAYGAATPKK